METAISLPFKVSPYGGIVATTEQTKIWSDRVRSVIGTNLRERVMRPNFGSLVPSAFMETTESAQTLIESEVTAAFANQLSLLSLQSTEVTYDEYSNYLNVTITYALPSNEEVKTTVKLITLDGKNPSTEENL